VQVGLQMFLTQGGDLWGPLMAAASLASLPIFGLYFVLQRQVVEAFVRSGLIKPLPLTGPGVALACPLR